MYVSISGSTVLDGTGFASCNGSALGVGVVEILQAFLGITVQGEENIAKTPHEKYERMKKDMYSGKTVMQLCDILQYGHNTHGKYAVCTLYIEVTRKCNLACAHCMKGDPQNLDIPDEYVDSVMSQVSIIYCLVLSGGEVTLALDRLRYILDSAKRHNVKICRIALSTNGVVKDPEFLEIYEEYKRYVLIPTRCEICISNDRYHTQQTRFLKKDYLDRKKFFTNNRKNHVSFQDVAYPGSGNLKRCGRCEKKPKFDGKKYMADSSYMKEYQFKYKLYLSASKNELMKRPIRYNGKHICQICLTATGHILTVDCISYRDEDSSEFYNGHILDTIAEIIDREKVDPYMRTIGEFLKKLDDIANVGSKIRGLYGFMGLGAYGNLGKILPLMEALKEIIESAIDLIPVVRETEFYRTHTEFFDKAIKVLESMDMDEFEKIMNSVKPEKSS